MDQQVEIEPMARVFSGTMQLMTWIGLTILVVFGLLYITGLMPGNVELEDCINYWGKPTSDFWQATAGRKANGYKWFLMHLNTGDSWSLVGVALLAFSPVVSLLLASFKAPRIFKLILFVLCLELIFAVIRPFIIGNN
jgi:hypothetical protein